MIAENTYNAYYLVQGFIECGKYILIFLGAIFVLTNLINMLGRYGKDRLDKEKDIHFKDKDVEVVTDAFKKIGEIKNGTKNEKILNAQNIENNKEIFNHDKKIDDFENRIKFLETYTKQMNIDIQEQLKSILEVLNRG